MIDYDPDWTTCMGCGTSMYEHELCPECGYCGRCCECDLVLTRLLRDLEALVQALRDEALVRPEMMADGLYEAAYRIEEIIERFKQPE